MRHNASTIDGRHNASTIDGTAKNLLRKVHIEFYLISPDIML